MPEVCICYTSDVGYLFPSFVSALQARRNTNRNLTDILLIGIDIDPELQKNFSKLCKKNDIVFLCYTASDIDHAPATTLARLFLDDLLPSFYKRFLYVDGDTQIRGDLDRLLNQPLATGTFAAVTDPMSFTLGDDDQIARSFQKHCSSLGFSDRDAKQYFNAGVIYADRAGWGRIGREAWKKFGSLQPKPSYLDQDVLNLVGLPHRLTMSFSWNFPIFFRNISLDPIIAPCIYHFMSSPKPWDANLPPWDVTASSPYNEIIGAFPELASYRKRMSPTRLLRYTLQQRYKRWLERREWSGERMQRILAYEQNADIKSGFKTDE
ncbi:glycosyltransferase family 8 protein [Acetobacter sp.]|jgi:lipopolysaccharide biosynthesis glycosyltransferase|uniref:glycosyltransferase family 8 protein n=1 Tax=Acetobacter sp. TaxID=440 RepID=UPI0025BFD3FC|nr:glycosyltransferase [Acetobacter sp.]MCH4092429.1 glycosyl transferase family 8 [Acetobacter sp.]MCI1299562.1 glycosyl transferase family 8 [Acetobacter sp.]MCI1315558.1 glycosyl transferase family 8 [Acetobacter sp.]